MKTTRNSPRARKERAVAKRFLRVDRLTERQMMRFHPSMLDQFEQWHWLRRRLVNLANTPFITKEGFQAWDAL